MQKPPNGLCAYRAMLLGTFGGNPILLEAWLPKHWFLGVIWVRSREQQGTYRAVLVNETSGAKTRSLEINLWPQGLA